jgi:MFS family permease
MHPIYLAHTHTHTHTVSGPHLSIYLTRLDRSHPATRALLTYRVKTFEQFFLLRTLTGVAVGGAFPLIYSLASDITTPEQRALASSMITVSMGMGGTLGQGVAGASVVCSALLCSAVLCSAVLCWVS